MKSLLRVLQYFRPERKRILFALILLFISTGLNLLKPWPLALVVDSILGDQPLPAWLVRLLPAAGDATWLWLLAGALFLLHAGHSWAMAGQNITTIQVGLSGLARVRTEVFNKLQRLSLKFHHRQAEGDTLYRATWDAYAFQTLFQQGIFTFLTAGLSVLLMMIIMLRLNVPLTVVALATVPLLVLAMRHFGTRMKHHSLGAHAADSRLTSIIQQLIHSLPIVQSYARQPHELDRFQSAVHHAFRQRVTQHRAEVRYSLVVGVIFAAGTAATVWLGAQEVRQQNLSLGELLVFISYLAQLYDPLNQLSHLRSTVSDAGAGTQRVFEILDASEDVRSPSSPAPFPNLPALAPAVPLLELDQVWFSYQPDRPVLRDVSLQLRPGQSIALTGPSGSGKSTLLHLLLRFYDPSRGRILLAGTRLPDLNLDQLRESIAFLPQESLLLPASVAENIAYGRPAASRDAIVHAAKAARAHDFIERLPDGYDTLVGDMAARLSSGEKQRLNLARAFLKDAPLVLLDEPTSALDQENEALIMESLKHLLQGRAAIIVAHRLSTLEQAEQVYTLREGTLTSRSG